ncbi:MAG: hypothetical protein GY821_04420 [Gammaproteobacteria bacterium]|nr:hypothetical protein [Gammaproteobacteria bacterium]
MSRDGFDFSRVCKFLDSSPSFNKINKKDKGEMENILKNIEENIKRICKKHLNSINSLDNVALKRDLSETFSSLELRVAALVQDSLSNRKNFKRNLQSLERINSDLSVINSNEKEDAAKNIESIYDRVYGDSQSHPSDKKRELKKCSKHIDLIMKMSRFEAKQGNNKKGGIV